MRQLIDVGGAVPLLDVASYARKGPGRRDRLSPAEIELIRRTVNRTPEVMVKVLTRGGQNFKAVRAHLTYLNRGGKVEIETDDGERLSGEGAEKEVLEDWNLDLDEYRRGSKLGPRTNKTPAKLAHKILFSMPPGTPPEKVLKAVKNFAREEFGLKHRYAMVLHTDEPHPQVHVLVKAVSEQGVGLNIRKATLRDWRRDFARHLRDRGVAANATERAVRGETKTPQTDGVYRASLRNDSRRISARVEAVASELRNGNIRTEPGQTKLRETRKQVEQGWWGLGDIVHEAGDAELARQIVRFTTRMLRPLTDREQIAAELSEKLREYGRSRQ